MSIVSTATSTKSLFLRVKYGREIYYALATGNHLEKGTTAAYRFESCGNYFMVEALPSVDGDTFDWRNKSNEKVAMSPKLIQLMGKEIERQTFEQAV